MKEESRILVYGIGEYFYVFATYRRNFIEELLITPRNTLLVDRYLQKNLRTYNEVSYITPCIGSKYDSLISPRFRVIEGGDGILIRREYCSLIETLICILDKRGLLNPSNLELLVETSHRCILEG